MKMNIPDNLKKLHKIFSDNNFDFYLVGGCVRSHLLKKPIKDYDICTNATPEEMLNIASNHDLKTLTIGIEHGTVNFMIKKTLYENTYTHGSDNSLPIGSRTIVYPDIQYDTYEITTYRSESDYTDNRHPDSVKFINSIDEDLERRDLTINALYYDIATDTVKSNTNHTGLQDIKSRSIKCVGLPSDRFNQDALRIMRAIRFASQLNFEIHKETWKAIVDNRFLLNNISRERIRAEFVKILTSNNPNLGLSLLEKSKVLYTIFPELYNIKTDQCNQNHLFNIWLHTIMSVKHVRCNLTLRLAMFFHDTGKPSCKTTDEYGIDHFYDHPITSAFICDNIMKRLKFDTKTIQLVKLLVQLHDENISSAYKKKIKKLLHKTGSVENFKLLLEVKKADTLAQSSIRAHGLNKIDAIIYDTLPQIISNNDPLFLKDLAVNGSDIMKHNPSIKGKSVGIILDRLLHHVWAIPSDNSKDQLLKLIKGMRG